MKLFRINKEGGLDALDFTKLPSSNCPVTPLTKEGTVP